MIPKHLILLCLLCLLGACASTQVDESWRLPGYQPVQPQKVLVVAMTQEEELRELIENTFCAQLEARGIEAIASFQWLTDGSRLDREALLPVVQQNGVTVVLATSLKDMQKVTAYQPEQSLVPEDGLFRQQDTWFAYSSSGQHESGRYAALTDYVFETNLFDSRQYRLSWSVITRSSETGSVDKVVDAIARTVLKQADKDRIF